MAGIYSDRTCVGKKIQANPFEPQPHQIETRDAFMASKYKGMELYHRLGSGKTCTSIMIADAMLEAGKIKHVYVLSPGSLREGWVREFCSVCGADRKLISNDYTFITYNYNVGDRLPDFSDSLVIIDEAHNLMAGLRNKAKTAVQIYMKILTSNCRVLALSGTPISASLDEWPFMGNMLKPGTFRGEESFKDNWEKDAEFDQKIAGIISYFPGSGEEFYPKVIFRDPIKVMMSPIQERKYYDAVIFENMYSQPPPDRLRFLKPKEYYFKRKMFILSKKRIITRRISNFMYPDGVIPRQTIREEESDGVPDALVADGGWLDCGQFDDRKLVEYSSKFVAVLLNIIINPDQKHVIFTFFKTRSGAYLLKGFFDMIGISSEIFSGDLSDSTRKSLLMRFNNVNNRYGEKIRVMIVTEAGAEGITILEARHMHIIESSPKESLISQAIGRIVRFKSHFDMPKDEQNVTIWRYWSSIGPKLFPAIDEKLYLRGQEQQKERDYFLKHLQEASVTSI
jgi:superfamily II DNA or RNA helicase